MVVLGWIENWLVPAEAIALHPQEQRQDRFRVRIRAALSL
jgi:hypothetical protein